jgi:hypothetical protein
MHPTEFLMKKIAMSLLVLTTSVAATSHALTFKGGKVSLENLEEYNTCQDHDYSGEWCHDALVRWVGKHPADAFKAGKMTRLKLNHHNAIPFFVKAFAAKAGDCNDEDVKLAVVSGLALPPSYANLAGAKQLGFTTCSKELQKALVDELTGTGYFADNVCPTLKAAKALTAEKAKHCEPKEEPKETGPKALAPGEDKTVNPYGKFFEGEGIEIEMVSFEEKNADGLNDVLVRMKGADAHTAKIDGKVIRLVAVPSSRQGADYKYTNEKGDILNRIGSRKNWGDELSYEVYFGNKSISLSSSARKAKDMKPVDMLTEYKGGGTTPPKKK